jgi:hypothetical protein
MNSYEEIDDDSPYFLKITLDATFLSYLEEPELFASTDVPANHQVIMDNKVFKEIVKSEFEIMFGSTKKCAHNENVPDEEHGHDHEEANPNKTLDSHSLSSKHLD